MPKREPIQIEDNLWVVVGTRGRFSYVDTSYFEECRHYTGLVAVPADYTWHASVNDIGRFSGLMTNIRGKNIRLHSLLSGYANTDHKDGNPCNNVISNLRDGTDNVNRRAFRTATGSSDFLGVNWDKKWRAQIGTKGRKISLYYGDDEVEAARAYDRKVIELGWPIERTNKYKWPELFREAVA